MANTYTWDFPTLDVCNEAQNGHADCIHTIHWRLTAVSDSETNFDGEPLSVTAYGTAAVATPEEGDSDYIAFDSITKDWCKGKALESLGKTEAEMQTMLDEQMTALANPPMRQAVPAGW
jgi:hypothetical protein